jgi:uncharacterized protein (TIGR00725 family)
MFRRPVIAVVGTGTQIEQPITHARELGRLIADRGWVLITGGRDCGVMKAASEGAKTAKDSLTIGILPYRDASVSPAVDVAIITDTGEARNNIIVLSADVVIACGADGAGTASEIALAIKNEKHVILLAARNEATTFFTSIADGKIYTAESAGAAIAIVESKLADPDITIE